MPSDDNLGNERPRVSVVIPVRNDPVHLAACLEALCQTQQAGYEVIVVDDASTDHTPEVARRARARILRLERQSGPAAARNRGAAAARGEIVVFIDADVCVTPQTLAQFIAVFDEHPDVSAAFGSYDTRPAERRLISQYKNLLHHFVHQQGDPQASTFWSGCGAVRRAVFLQLGGFSAHYGRPCIEDIELGLRLRAAGHRILLDRNIQVTHLKRWTLRGLIKTDVFDRAVPWTQLILRERSAPNDLNLKSSQRASGALCCLAALAFAGGCAVDGWLVLLPAAVLGALLLADRFDLAGRAAAVVPAVPAAVLSGGAIVAAQRWGFWSLAVLLPAAGMVGLNWRLFDFYARARGVLFAAAVVPLHALYFVYSTAAFAGCVLQHYAGRLCGATRPPQREALSCKSDP